VSEPVLDWSSASVSGGELVVAIAGELPSGWKRDFEATVALLDHSGSLSIQVKKQKLTVGGISSGEEERVRHLLESSVQQANADLLDEDEDEDGGENDGEHGDDAPEESDSDTSEDDPDAEMTDRFRSFAS
jgi:hypothetical protein